MPDPEPRLRTVPSSEEAPESEAADSGGVSSRLTLVLGGALAVALVLLVWSRLQLGNRIDVLETEARAMQQTILDHEATIAEQRATIAAHQERLGDARARAEALLDLLSQPVEGTR